MEVEAAVETPLVFAGDKVQFTVAFHPPPAGSGHAAPTLLSGYAVVQGSFKLGDMLLSEPFADTRKQGIVLTRRGIEYGQPQSSGGFFAGMLDGLRHLVVAAPSERAGTAGGPRASSPGSSALPGGGGSGSASGAGRGSAAGLMAVGHDEGDYPVFATSQLLLFTDLKLTKTEKFHLEVEIPHNLPPTYRSRSIQITYSLVVGFERIRLDANGKPLDPSPVDSRLFLPFRLLARAPTPAKPVPPTFDLRHPVNAPPPRLLDSGRETSDHGAAAASAASAADDRSSAESSAGPDAGEPGEDLSMSSTDSARDASMRAFMDELLHQDSHINSRRNRSSSVANLPGAQYTRVSYDISKNKTKIAQLVLAKPATFVGDVLAAQIKINRPCLQISIYLELEEQIEEPYAALAHTPLGANSGSGLGAGSGNSATAGGASAHGGSRTGSHSSGNPGAGSSTPPNFSNDNLASNTNGNTSTPGNHSNYYNTSNNRSSASGAGAGAGASTGAGSETSGGNTNSATKHAANPDSEVATAYTIYARQFQGVYGLKELPVYLPTLTSITPRLDTEQITSSWSLRLEFVGLIGSAFAMDEENGLLAKGQVDHEMFTCRIPVVILPPVMGGHSVAKTWRV